MIRRHAIAVLLFAMCGTAHAGEPAPTPARAVIGRFSTSYAFDPDHKSRALNVELAAEAIDGKVIPANATFSFNDAVGERTAAFGFAKSIVIRDRMMAEGMGGGTCQVASTLHASALLAGLDVVLRAPHTRPSAYIRMGFDATVAFPSIDLKLKNPMSAAVVLHARAARGVLDVWFDGPSTVKPDVSLTSELLERTPFTRVIERDKSLRDDVVHIKAFGIPGYRVRRVREIRAEDGTVRHDVRIDVYPPTNAVVRVAPSFDESRLRRDHRDVGDEVPDEERLPVASTVDPGVSRPVLVQLRPSPIVVLDNGLRAAAATASPEP